MDQLRTICLHIIQLLRVVQPSMLRFCLDPTCICSGAALLASSRIQAQAKGAINIIAAAPSQSKHKKAKAAAGKAAGGQRVGGEEKERYEMGPDMDAGAWQLVADGLDAIRAEGRRLERCRGADHALGARLSEVVQLLEERQEAAEKMNRARLRVARTLGLGGTGAGGEGAASGRRARSTVKYDFSEYDKQLQVI